MGETALGEHRRLSWSELNGRVISLISTMARILTWGFRTPEDPFGRERIISGRLRDCSFPWHMLSLPQELQIILVQITIIKNYFCPFYEILFFSLVSWIPGAWCLWIFTTYLFKACDYTDCEFNFVGHYPML